MSRNVLQLCLKLNSEKQREFLVLVIKKCNSVKVCDELDAFCTVDPYTPEEQEPEEVDVDHKEETTDDVNKDEEQTEEGNC